MLFILIIPSNGDALENAPRCPDGIGSHYGDRPQLIYQVPHGPELIVCGDDSNEESPGSKIYRMSEFDLFSIGASSRSTPELIFTAGALETYRVWVNNGKGLFFQKQLAHGIAHINIPIFCKKNSCTRGMETCRIIAKKHPYPKTIANILNWTNSGDKNSDELDDLIEKLVEEAVSGDYEAIQFLKSKNLSDITMSFAAIEENRREGIQALDTLKRLHCLK